MFYGETILSGASDLCDKCGSKFKFEVLSYSGSDYYIGTRCNNEKCNEFMMPNTRESNSFKTQQSAITALEQWSKGNYINAR